jgi:hypothetical protein
VGGVPQDVGRKEKESDRGRQIWTARVEVTPEARQEKPDADARAKPQHARLVQQPESKDQAQEYPSFRGGVLVKENEDVRRQHPEEDVEAVHRVVGVESQNLGRTDEGERGDDHGGAAAAQPADQEAQDADGQPRDDGGDKTDCENRIAQEGPGQRQQKDREGWLVDVPGGEMSTARQVVQLVAKVAVPAQSVYKHMHAEGQKSHDDGQGDRSRGNPHVR